MENQPVDDPQTGKFTWTIENFSKINLRKHYSESFTVGGYKWYAYLFLITLLRCTFFWPKLCEGRSHVMFWVISSQARATVSQGQ